MCGSCLASLLLYTIFPTSRLGWVNLSTACSLLFVLLLCVIFTVMVSSGLCLAAMYFICFLQCIWGYCYCLLVFTTGRIGFKLVLCYLGLFWGDCLICLNFNFLGPCELVAPF